MAISRLPTKSGVRKIRAPSGTKSGGETGGTNRHEQCRRNQRRAIAGRKSSALQHPSNGGLQRHPPERQYRRGLRGGALGNAL